MCIGSQNLSMNFKLASRQQEIGKNQEILNDKVLHNSIPDFGQNLSQSIHLSVIAK